MPAKVIQIAMAADIDSKRDKHADHSMQPSVMEAAFFQYWPILKKF
jgi:hypothetical protein